MEKDEPFNTYPKYLMVEDLHKYKTGGFHPITLKETINNRYKVIDKLGYGNCATVWVAHDLQKQTLVSLKVIISNVENTNESDLLRALNRPSHAGVPELLDAFEIQGPNGVHQCIVTPLTRGKISDALDKARFPLVISFAITAKLAIALAFIHSQGIVHGDIRPENIFVGFSQPPSPQEYIDLLGPAESEPVERQDGLDIPIPPNVPFTIVSSVELDVKAIYYKLSDADQIVISDFGESFLTTSSQSRLGRDSCTPIDYASPEVFFEPGAPLTPAFDVWALAVTFWNLFFGLTPFPSSIMGRVHLGSEMIDYWMKSLQDSLPAKWEEIWQRQLPNDAIHIQENDLPSKLFAPVISQVWGFKTFREELEDGVRGMRFAAELACRRYSDHGLEPDDILLNNEQHEAMREMFTGMLRLDPTQRWTAAEILKCKWMDRWGIPALEQAKQSTEYRGMVSERICK